MNRIFAVLALALISTACGKDSISGPDVTSGYGDSDRKSVV